MHGSIVINNTRTLTKLLLKQPERGKLNATGSILSIIFTLFQMTVMFHISARVVPNLLSSPKELYGGESAERSTRRHAQWIHAPAPPNLRGGEKPGKDFVVFRAPCPLLLTRIQSLLAPKFK